MPEPAATSIAIKPVLYTNAKGYNVTTGSYSARDLFHYCPRKFKLKRIDGWNQKEQRASALFGKATEAGIQWYEESNREPNSGIKKFVEEWGKIAELSNAKDLTYTDTEGGWASLLRAGIEIQKLYEIRVPCLPISPLSVLPKTSFQVEMRKKIFPGSELDILSNVAYLDMITHPSYDHPWLVPLGPKYLLEGGSTRRKIIVDIKTSGVDLETKLIALDPQLIEYAWQSGIYDVAFLWLKKSGHSLSKRDRVTLLESVNEIPAGTELFVLGVEKVQKPKASKKPRKKKGSAENELVETTPAEIPADVGKIIKVFLGDFTTLKNLQEATKGVNANSKIYDDIAAKFFQGRNVITTLPEKVTKQRLQFASTRISETAVQEMGQSIGRTTIEMVRAHNDGFYAMQGGIRFPQNKCTWCEMRGICADIPELRDELLVRAGDEWMEAEQDVD